MLEIISRELLQRRSLQAGFVDGPRSRRLRAAQADALGETVARFSLLNCRTRLFDDLRPLCDFGFDEGRELRRRRGFRFEADV